MHIGLDLPGLAAYSAALACNELPANPFLVHGQTTTADPSRSPAGTEAAWAYARVPRGLDWNSNLSRQSPC